MNPSRRTPYLLFSLLVSAAALAAPAVRVHADDPPAAASPGASSADTPAPVETDDPYATYKVRINRKFGAAKRLQYTFHFIDQANISANAGVLGDRTNTYIEVQADVVERPLRKDAVGVSQRQVVFTSIAGRTDPSQDMQTLKIKGIPLLVTTRPTYRVSRVDGRPITPHERAFIDLIFKNDRPHESERPVPVDPPGELHIGDTWTPSLDTLAQAMSVPGVFALRPDGLNATFSLDERSIVDGVDSLVVSADITEDDVPTRIPTKIVHVENARSSIEMKRTWTLPVDLDEPSVSWTQDSTINVTGTVNTKNGPVDVSGNIETTIEMTHIKAK